MNIQCAPREMNEILLNQFLKNLLVLIESFNQKYEKISSQQN